ncbi:uncharacterized protein LOC144785225 [Lissotriton helveticus]
MEEYYEEDDYYEEDASGSMEQDLVDALDQGVQHSVNKALVRAITPLKRHLSQYAMQQGWLPSASLRASSSKSPHNRHKSDLKKLAKALSSDHSGSKSSKDVLSFEVPLTDTDDSTYPSSSDHDDFVDGPTHPQLLTFEPSDIIHPNSSSWLPSPAVAEYVQAHIRQPFEKGVRARLRSECPRPDLADSLADTPEVDPTMVTYLKKYAKDPKKGYDRAWRSCQDQLLDLLGPLTKILDLGFQAKESSALVDPDKLIEWSQRTTCQLGNANCAMSCERRRSILLKVDPKLAELSLSESSPLA